MSLEQWLRNGWLQRHEPTVAEVLQLLQVVDRELSDARAQGLSAEGRFMHAYDAALQLCAVSLCAEGFRTSKGQGHHLRSIQSLPHSLGAAWSETAYYLDRCSRLRGQAMYERSGVVSTQDADDLLNTASQLRIDVIAHLKADHPAIVPPGL